jgi:hypothetical protein
VGTGSREENASKLKTSVPSSLSPLATIDGGKQIPHLACSIVHSATNPRGRSSMPNDTRELPGSNDGLYRFLGGSPLTVAFRLILLSILVGVVLAAIGFDPWNIVNSIRRLFNWIYNLGFDAINGLWRYFLLGAVIVVPIWLISRLFATPRGR